MRPDICPPPHPVVNAEAQPTDAYSGEYSGKLGYSTPLNGIGVVGERIPPGCVIGVRGSLIHAADDGMPGTRVSRSLV